MHSALNFSFTYFVVLFFYSCKCSFQTTKKKRNLNKKHFFFVDALLLFSTVNVHYDLK